MQTLLTRARAFRRRSNRYYLSLVPSGGLSDVVRLLQDAGLNRRHARPAAGALVAGDTIPGAFAAAIQSLQYQYNAQIAAAVTATGATLVDVHAVYATIYAGGGYPVNLPSCCSTI